MEIGDSMKRKQGFTMVELLAVIIILAIVIAIATLAVLGFLRSSRVTTCENLMVTIKREAETHVLGTNRDPVGTHTVNLDTLCNEGLIECPIVHPITGEELNNNVSVNLVINNNGVITNTNINNMECET